MIESVKTAPLLFRRLPRLIGRYKDTGAAVQIKCEEPLEKSVASKRRKPSNATTADKIKIKKEDTFNNDKEDVKLRQVTVKQESKSDVVKEESTSSDSHFSMPIVPGNSFDLALPSDISSSQPKNWQTIYNEVVKMRGKIMAPVDSMGCEKMPDTLSPKLSHDQPRLYRFQLLVSLMLSSQTKDEINHEAMKSLKSHFLGKGFPNGICIEAVREASEAEIDQCIQRVGFHRRKAVYIKKACELLHEEFGGDVPKTIEDVVRLPGVGPKMGYLLLQFGWGINSGIGVDVHIHRLAQNWGWVRKSDKPEVTRADLEGWLPRRLWAQVNPLLVGFGQTVCNSQMNNCDVCTLAENNLCKGVNKKLVNSPMSEARLQKLKKQRADLTVLL